jgi:hypothetical protein
MPACAPAKSALVLPLPPPPQIRVPASCVQVLTCLVFTSMCVSALLLGRRSNDAMGRVVTGIVAATCMLPCRVLLPWLYKAANAPLQAPKVWAWPLFKYRMRSSAVRGPSSSVSPAPRVCCFGGVLRTGSTAYSATPLRPLAPLSCLRKSPSPPRSRCIRGPSVWTTCRGGRRWLARPQSTRSPSHLSLAMLTALT